MAANPTLADPATLEGTQGKNCNLSSRFQYPEMQNSLGRLVKPLAGSTHIKIELCIINRKEDDPERANNGFYYDEEKTKE